MHPTAVSFYRQPSRLIVLNLRCLEAQLARQAIKCMHVMVIRGVPVRLFPLVLVPIFIDHKYTPVQYRYFVVDQPRAVSSAGGSVGV